MAPPRSWPNPAMQPPLAARSSRRCPTRSSPPPWGLLLGNWPSGCSTIACMLRAFTRRWPVRWRALLVMHRGAVMPELPRVTFGIIVLNGEPFTRYCLRALYPFAHEIIVVEGAHEDTHAVATADGHSIDGTLEALRRFCVEEDREQKVTVVTKDGFWPKKDELGRCRTAQSRAYAERATGDYLWQVDIDEFYLADAMRRVLEMLVCDPEISAVSFRQRSFWGSPDIEVQGWPLRRKSDGVHR